MQPLLAVTTSRRIDPLAVSSAVTSRTERDDAVGRCCEVPILVAVVTAFLLPNAFADQTCVLSTRAAGRVDDVIDHYPSVPGELLVDGVETGFEWSGDRLRVHRVDNFVSLLISEEGRLFIWNSRPGARRLQLLGRGFTVYPVQGDGGLIVRRAVYAGDEEAGAHGLAVFDVDLGSSQPKLRELWRDDSRVPPVISFLSRHRGGLILLLENAQHQFKRLNLEPGGRTSIFAIDLFGARPHSLDGDRLLTVRPILTNSLQCQDPEHPDDYDVEVAVVDLKSGAGRSLGTARGTWRPTFRDNLAPDPDLLLAWEDEDVLSRPPSFWRPMPQSDACAPLDSGWPSFHRIANFVIRTTEQVVVIKE
jgi:hypothetical protein